MAYELAREDDCLSDGSGNSTKLVNITKENGEIMALRKQDFHDNDKQKVAKSAHITFSITPELLHRIETAAAQKKLSIDDYLEPILNQSIPDEPEGTQDHLKRLSPEFLQKVYQVRERIQRESGGQLFEDSAEVIRRMREERTQHLEHLQEQE